MIQNLNLPIGLIHRKPNRLLESPYGTSAARSFIKKRYQLCIQFILSAAELRNPAVYFSSHRFVATLR